jgi:alanine dehydrogenase
MTIVLNNEDIAHILTMNDCLEVLEEAFKELGHERAINTPRCDVWKPHPQQGAIYRFKSMQGTVPKFGVHAMRLTSDLITYPSIGGKERHFRIPAEQHGRFIGLVLLFSTETCEPLAIMQGGHLQRMRVGATTGLGAKYLARENANSIGIIGSGWQAETQLMALCAVRDISRIKVFSITPDHKERFALKMSKILGIDLEPVADAQECIKGSDIVCLATSSRVPVINGEWLEAGMHISSIYWLEMDDLTYRRSDIRITNIRPWEKGVEEYFPYIQEYALGVNQKETAVFGGVKKRAFDWQSMPSLPELMLGNVPGRSDSNQITLHINNVGVGIQFAAVGARIYELAKSKRIGREIPTEWFLQTVQG